MAQTNQKGQTKVRKPKLLLKNIFTLGFERRDVEWPDTFQTPDGKTHPYVPKYADGLGGSWKAYRGEQKTLVKASAYFLIFIAPLIVLLLYGLNAMMSVAFVNIPNYTGNFMGNVGIGYPGGVDSLLYAEAVKIGVYKYFMLFFYAGAVIASIGMAGLGNVARKVIWNEPIKYVAKPFFKGIKKYWWQYMLTVAIGGGIALGMGEGLLYLLGCIKLGTATAGAYCAGIIPMIIGAPLLLVPFTVLTILPSYKVGYVECVKNAIVLLLNRFPVILITAILSCLPIVLVSLSTVIAIIAVLVMVVFGCALLAMLWTGVGHGAYLKCAVTYEYLDEEEKRNKATSEREKKYAEQKEIRGDVVKKPQVQKQQFQNPKKKKKK